MRRVDAFRVAAVLLVLYTLGHTFGALVITPRFGAESDAVVASMRSVHVPVQGMERTWYGFYLGFGAMVSVYFALSVYVAWRLGGASDEDWRVLAPIAWAFVLSHALGAVLTFIWFFPVPMALSTLITIALAIGCVQRSSRQRSATMRP